MVDALVHVITVHVQTAQSVNKNGFRNPYHLGSDSLKAPRRNPLAFLGAILLKMYLDNVIA